MTNRSPNERSFAARIASGLFGIDARSLALFRISAATLLLVDLLISSRDLRAMYAADGMYPIEAARQYYPSAWHWSLHFLHGSVAFQTLLFVVAAIFAVALLIGYRTRLATVASWILLASLHVRAPLLYNGGDMLLRLLLFWSMFLPLGRVWSVDARRGKTTDRQGPVVSVASAAILLQICLMYWFTGLFKFNEEWLSGSAVSNALALDFLSKPLGKSLLAHPHVLQWITHATLWFELLGPVLVWLPWRTPRIRMAAIAGFVALHLGIELCVHVGLFSFISIAAWTLFLPAEFWRSRPETQTRSPARHRFAWLAGQAVCLALLLYVVAWNVASLNGRVAKTIMPRAIQFVGHATMLQQRWIMFGRIPEDDGWYVARATLKDGTVVDVFRDGLPVTTAEPPSARTTFPNQHWLYFFRLIAKNEHAYLRQPAADFLYRSWNERHSADRQIEVLDLMYFENRRGRDLQPGDYSTVVLARAGSHPSDTAGNFARAMQAITDGENAWP